jgi:hypothetical protein
MSNFYIRLLITTVAFCFGIYVAAAQVDSLDLGNAPEKIIIRSAFNGSTIVNSQSTNVADGGQLNLIIGHRFGTVNQGAFNFFGLDEAVMRLGFEYGVSDNLTLGIGRLTLGKSYDAYVKYRLLTQTKGQLSGNIPLSITLFASTAFSSEKLKALDRVSDNNQFIPNLTYSYQALVSREFSPGFSLQVSPTYVHQNQTDLEGQHHDIYALGTAARIKLSGRLHLDLDYSFVKDKNKMSTEKLQNPIGLALDIVTGGHVFKLHFTNSAGIIEKEYLLQTTDNFFRGGIRFGFTVLRSFAVKPKVKGGSIR